MEYINFILLLCLIAAVADLAGEIYNRNGRG